MRITQWGEYGVHACVFLASRAQKGKNAASASEISQAQNIDILYTQQILQRLRRSGIVESIRGPQGGYKLSRIPSEITLKDILNATEGDTFEIICESKPLDSARCAENAVCYLRPVWHNLREHIDSFLEKVSIQTLLDSETKSDSQTVQIGKEIQAQ